MTAPVALETLISRSRSPIQSHPPAAVSVGAASPLPSPFEPSSSLSSTASDAGSKRQSQDRAPEVLVTHSEPLAMSAWLNVPSSGLLARIRPEAGLTRHSASTGASPYAFSCWVT